MAGFSVFLGQVDSSFASVNARLQVTFPVPVKILLYS